MLVPATAPPASTRVADCPPSVITGQSLLPRMLKTALLVVLLPAASVTVMAKVSVPT